VSELIDLGLITDDQAGPSSGGRPARALAFRAHAGHTLVADLHATHMTVGVSDLAGTVAAHAQESVDIDAGPDTVMPQLMALGDSLIADLQGRTGGLCAIGVSIPLPVEKHTGRPVAPTSFHGWDGYDIRGTLQQRYAAPVWVDNDVNALALGEWRYGASRGQQDVITVKVGTGIGAATISDGRLHRGAQGTAGYIGHIHVSDDPRLVCGCGRTGCLEAMASGMAIARDAELAARTGRSEHLRAALEARTHLTAHDVGSAAARGDQVSAELLTQSARQVGTVLAALVNICNPSLVVLGGGVPESGDGYLATIRETVYRFSLPLATRHLQIQRARLGPLGGLRGAAVMALDHLFSGDGLPWPAFAPGNPASQTAPQPGTPSLTYTTPGGLA
jgi:glucokinase-like ROK family protein